MKFNDSVIMTILVSVISMVGMILGEIGDTVSRNPNKAACFAGADPSVYQS